MAAPSKRTQSDRHKAVSPAPTVSDLEAMLVEAFERCRSSQVELTEPVDLYKAVEREYGSIGAHEVTVPTQDEIDAYISRRNTESTNAVEQYKVAYLKIAIGYLNARAKSAKDVTEYLASLKTRLNPAEPTE